MKLTNASILEHTHYSLFQSSLDLSSLARIAADSRVGYRGVQQLGEVLPSNTPQVIQCDLRHCFQESPSSGGERQIAVIYGYPKVHKVIQR